MLIEIECPEEYNDVSDEIILDDFLDNPDAWTVRLAEIVIPQDFYTGDKDGEV